MGTVVIHHTHTMNFVLLALVFGVAAALPQSYSGERDVIPILRDDRHSDDSGAYSFDFETGNGIVRSESGDQLNVEQQPIGMQGSYSYPLPDGQTFTLKFVANDQGFQPESPFSPSLQHSHMKSHSSFWIRSQRPPEKTKKLDEAGRREHTNKHDLILSLFILQVICIKFTSNYIVNNTKK